MIETINENWRWAGVEAEKVLMVNDFGNIIFLAKDNSVWRICPEELYCRKIANDPEGFETLKQDEDFLSDWEVPEMTDLAKKILGPLNPDEKYCLKLPAVLGGLYEESNLGKILHSQQIAYSGKIAEQVKDLPDGARINL